ncbi:small nuclear ribonucleoprotein F [Trichomonascus vanleenenianus]|uniref:mRNA splicing protein SMX3 n=1 Tax=Trichomonascus vanleenenianus TaxID=2268995 RepID=UPI003EC9FE39
MFAPLNPKPFLQSLTGQNVIVKLKWGETEYRGKLLSVDSYMNIQLDNAHEYIDLEDKGELGEMLIRCNNVLWITKDKSGEDTEMKESS